MIGLPACGKTTWAEKLCSDHPEKRYSILGTNLIMEKMKVSGLARKENYHGRWETLIKKATETLNKLFLLAPKNYRNYIIDQVSYSIDQVDYIIDQVSYSIDQVDYIIDQVDFVFLGIMCCVHMYMSVRL